MCRKASGRSAPPPPRSRRSSSTPAAGAGGCRPGRLWASGSSSERGLGAGREGDAQLLPTRQACPPPSPGGSPTPVLPNSKPLGTGLTTVRGFPRPLGCFWTPLWGGRRRARMGLGQPRNPNAETVHTYSQDACSHPDPALGARPAGDTRVPRVCTHGMLMSPCPSGARGWKKPAPRAPGSEEPGGQRPSPFSEPVPPRSPGGCVGVTGTRKGPSRPHPTPGPVCKH